MLHTPPFRLPILFLGAWVAAGCAHPAAPADDDPPSVSAASVEDAGRYLVLLSGCNDCHTAGWDQAGPDLPDSLWLTGSPVGWVGPWGTSYASNLRISLANLSEEEFTTMVHAREGLPPMPWANLRLMHPDDLSALYRYIRGLGPRGEPMPAPLPPGMLPAGPYFQLVRPGAVTE